MSASQHVRVDAAGSDRAAQVLHLYRERCVGHEWSEDLFALASRVPAKGAGKRSLAEQEGDTGDRH